MNAVERAALRLIWINLQLMESSRTAFLLARFLGFEFWINAIFETTYVLDRLWTFESYRTAAGRHYAGMFLALMIGRVALNGIIGCLLWWNASRVARWLEGKAKEEHPVDAPPLSSP